jgi:ferric-dicitrate binding protein FerR (iron transport regulator)
MKITEALLGRFFNNDCDEAEQQAVRNYFIRHPEVMKKYMTEQSWRAFETDNSLPEPVSEKMLTVIRQQTHRSRSVIAARWWAAAAAMLALSFGTYLYSRFNVTPPAKATAKQTIIQPESLSNFRNTSNNSSKPLAITLEDGTRVKLAPHSELGYPVAFLKDRRELTLKGQAIFYVAKDPSRPFTVHAGKLATTAIGTVFRITAFNGKTTSVQLLSGKVRVEADSNVLMKGKNITYLLPGQELQLDAQQHLLVFDRKEKTHKPALAVSTQQIKQTDSTVTIFRNEPLEQILITLSKKYLTKISFRPQQLEGMSFTGKYDHRKETLAGFIQTISLLNNLVMREENGEIIIKGQ